MPASHGDPAATARTEGGGSAANAPAQEAAPGAAVPRTARRRRFTFGRVLALLFLGIAIGAGIFIVRHLRPAAVERQVREALDGALAARYDLDAVVLDLGTGVELRGLRILYPDGDPAIDAERVLLTVDHQALLRGNVEIRQVDVWGLVVRLRPDPSERDGAPTLPGLFRSAARSTPKTMPALPVIRFLPGQRPCRIEVSGAPVVDPSLSLGFTIGYAEAHPDGALYTLDADIHAERLERAKISASLDRLARTVSLRVNLNGLQCTTEDHALLREEIARPLAALRVGGRADIVATARLTEKGVADLEVDAEVSNVHGSFGRSGEDAREGHPFRFERGHGRLRLKDERVEVSSFAAVFVSPSGREGSVEASLQHDLASVSRDLDLRLQAKDIALTHEEVALLLGGALAENIAARYEPGGTFDAEVTLNRRMGRPEKARAHVRLREGRFRYAGMFSQELGRRLGFDYLLQRCSGTVRIETAVEGPEGLMDVIDLEEIRGFHDSETAPGTPPVEALAHGRVVQYRETGVPGAESADVEILVRGLPIDGDLEKGFRATRAGLPYRRFELSGIAEEARILVRRDGLGDNVARATHDVTLRDCSLSYRGFPLHIVGLSGHVRNIETAADAEGPERDVLEFTDFSGQAQDGGSVTGGGRVVSAPGEPDRIDLTIHARDLRLASDIEQALLHSTLKESAVTDVWRRARPQGSIHADIHVISEEDADVEIDLNGTSMLQGYDRAVCPVTDLRGRVSYARRMAAFAGITGKIRDATVRLDGTVREAGPLDISAHVQSLPLDPEVQFLMSEAVPDLRLVFDRLGLHGDSRMDLSVHAWKEGSAPIAFRAEASNLALSTRIDVGTYEVRGGPVSWESGIVEVRDLQLDSEDAQVLVREGRLALKGGGGGRVFLDARNLGGATHLRRLFGAGAARVFGSNLRADMKAVEISFNRPDGRIVATGELNLRRHEVATLTTKHLEPTGSFHLDPVTITLPRTAGDPVPFSGRIRFHGVNLNVPLAASDFSGQLLIGEGTIADVIHIRGAIRDGEATVFRRHLQGIALNVDLDPYYLRFDDIDADFYGGKLRGEMEIHLPDPGGFRVQLRVSGADIGQMLREEMPRDQMKGAIEAAVEFQSPTGGVRNLAGRGQVRIRDGALFEVPTLRTMLATLGRVTPLQSRPRFKNAEVDFDIRGENLAIRRFHLSTATSDVKGRGWVSIYGDLDLIVEPQVTRFIDLPRVFNIPVLSTLRDVWHRTVYEIKLEGTVDSPTLRLRGFPWLRKQEPREQRTQARHLGQIERIRPSILP